MPLMSAGRKGSNTGSLRYRSRVRGSLCHQALADVFAWTAIARSAESILPISRSKNPTCLRSSSRMDERSGRTSANSRANSSPSASYPNKCTANAGHCRGTDGKRSRSSDRWPSNVSNCARCRRSSASCRRRNVWTFAGTSWSCDARTAHSAIASALRNRSRRADSQERGKRSGLEAGCVPTIIGPMVRESSRLVQAKKSLKKCLPLLPESCTSETLRRAIHRTDVRPALAGTRRFL